jgi:hypothetical protein
MAKDTKSATADIVTREYTIHLHKLVHGRCVEFVLISCVFVLAAATAVVLVV